MKQVRAAVPLDMTVKVPISQVTILEGEYLTVYLFRPELEEYHQIELRVTPDGTSEIFIGDEFPAVNVMTFRQWYDCEAEGSE